MFALTYKELTEVLPLKIRWSTWPVMSSKQWENPGKDISWLCKELLTPIINFILKFYFVIMNNVCIGLNMALCKTVVPHYKTHITCTKTFL